MRTRSSGLAVVLTILALGIARGQEKPLTEIPDEDAPILELKPLQRVKLKWMTQEFCFSANGKIFAVLDELKIRLWDVPAGMEIRCITLPKVPICRLAISPDGREVAYLAHEQMGYQIHIYDTESGKPTRTLAAADIGNQQVLWMQFTPDGKGILFARGRKDVRLWDINGNKVADAFKESTDAERGIRPAPDGKHVAVAPRGKPIRVFDLNSGKLLRKIPDAPDGGSYYDCLAFSAEGRFLTINEFCVNSVEVWDIHAGEVVWQFAWPESLDPKSDPLIPRPRTTGASGAVFSADGRTLRVAGYDGFDRVWEMATGGLRYRVRHNSFVIYAAAPASPFFAESEISRASPEIVLYDTRTCLPGPRLSTPPDMDKVWATLASDHAATAFENMRILIGLPKEATALLDSRLAPVERVSHTEIQKLIADLDDDDFAVRDKARKRLSELSDIGKSALTRALSGKPSEEVARSIKKLLSVFSGPARGDRIRVIRAVEVLETLATPEARKILKSCSSGEPTALLTREAKAALGRLDRE